MRNHNDPVKKKTSARTWRWRLLAVLMIVAMLLPVQAFAADPKLDPSKPVSLTIVPGRQAFEGLRHRIFKVASMDDSSGVLQFSVFGGFNHYASQFSLNAKTSSEWDRLARTLESIVTADQADGGPKKITAAGDDVTDEYGTLVFDDIEQGMYLVIPDVIEVDGKTITQSPWLVCLPDLLTNPKTQQKEWVYDVMKAMKPATEKNNTIDRRVLKVWKDDGLEAERPAEITVKLFCDGKELVDKRVVLSDKNNWRFEWKSLPAGHSYTIVEEGADGYEKTVDLQGITFVLTNSKTPPPPPPDDDNPPPDDDNPPPPPDGPPGTPPGVRGATRVPRVLGADRLPQTGLYWWPVPVMAGLGMAFLLVGYALKRHDDDLYELTAHADRE